MNIDIKVITKIKLNFNQLSFFHIYIKYILCAYVYTYVYMYIHAHTMYHDQVGFVPGIYLWFKNFNHSNVIHCLDKQKEISHMIIWLDEQKRFEKYLTSINDKNMPTIQKEKLS